MKIHNQRLNATEHHTSMAESTLKSLCSSFKLERDRGVQQLAQVLRDSSEDDIKQLIVAIQSILEDATVSWESKHGVFMAVKVITTHSLDEESTDFVKNAFDETFFGFVQNKAAKLLEDDEFRVRLAAGEVLGVLCKKCGTSVYTDSKEDILQGIRRNLKRTVLQDEDQAQKASVESLVEKLASSPTPQNEGRERRSSTSAEEIFHDTAGWKSLETWMRCLQTVIENCGHLFNPHVDQELLDLVFETLKHTNRFVRETGYYVCAALVSIGMTESDNGKGTVVTENNAIYQYGDHFVGHLADGLADNWSQVRLAASTATRKFLLSLPPQGQEKYFPAILPRLCLNRYYVAEGVRIYNQDTWKQVTAGKGRQMVEQHIVPMVEYYISQTEADNHAVREAACSCIAELGQKIDKDTVRPHVRSLLDALYVCFSDESWPVRDTSCVACGNFILCFPEESRCMMDNLYPLFYDNLKDNIPSVRCGAAVALANVARAYGQDTVEQLISKIKEGLTGIEDQAQNVQDFSSLEKGPALYGVVKRARDNDLDLHTDKQMYSCGSLAPKMHRGKRGGGCMDHQFRKPSEPWEKADGCVYLLAELSQLPACAQPVASLLPLLAKATTVKHFAQHIQFLETVLTELPKIAKGIGKRSFKMYIELFYDAIFYALGSDNALTSAAASQSLTEFSTLLGPNILRSRIEQYCPRYLTQLDAMKVFMPGIGAHGSMQVDPMATCRPTNFTM